MPRLHPDVNDQIVWLLNETSGTYQNTGQLLPNDPSTQLSTTGSIISTGTGIFTTNCPQIPGTSNFPVGSSATRNYIAGAKNVLINPPITLSCWVYLRSYTTTGNNLGLILKEYRDSGITNSWSAPFLAIGIYMLNSNSGGDWYGAVAINATTQAIFTVTDFPIPLGVWSHIGMTYDGTNIRTYLNGCQMIYYSGSTQMNTVSASALSYTDGTNGFGFWKAGAITATGSANKEEPNCQIQDVRIANVARPLSYFKRIYQSGALPLKAGTFSSNQFFKLRAYDLSCSTPTPVIWIDTQVSLANAPAFPCSGPYSAPEVLDTWYQ
jgi:hypothetical protein